jgi:hypothetical protein
LAQDVFSLFRAASKQGFIPPMFLNLAASLPISKEILDYADTVFFQ